MELMNIKQISEFLGGNIGTQKIRELMKTGQIPTIAAGGNNKLICKKEDVIRFKDSLFIKPNETLNTFPL